VIGDDPTHLTIFNDAVIWARQGVALDLPKEHTQALEFLGMVVVILPGDVVFMAQLVHHSLAEDVKKDGETYTEVRKLGDVALLVTTFKGEDKKASPAIIALAKKLANSARTPRPAEIARLHPKRFDPTMPREIWSN